MGNSPEAQAAREEAKQAEYARIRAEMEAAKGDRDFLKRKQVRLDSGYAPKLLEENCACDQVPGAGFYCTTCNGKFFSNCGRGMLCEGKQLTQGNTLKTHLK